MEEWIKKLEQAIEDSDDKTLKDEVLSPEHRDEIYREEFRKKIPQILMILWSKNGGYFMSITDLSISNV